MKLIEEEKDNLRQIGSLNKMKVFSLEEAEQLIPLLSIVSTKANRELNLLNSQLSMTKKNSPRAIEIQNKINHCLQAWSDKIRRLGLNPVSMGKVRILGETGDYIWEHPQKTLIIH